MPPEKTLSHLDLRGQARMVDVGCKRMSEREAVARGVMRMQPETMRLLLGGRVPKGDALAVARVAAIQAAKRTPELIPLCHRIALTGCQVDFAPDPDGERLWIRASARASDRTGAEMEALTAVSVAALTVYDMLKSVDRAMVIEQVVLLEKRGGKSGWYRRDLASPPDAHPPGSTRRSRSRSREPISRSANRTPR
jgi:cyclic pyranopterin phosphate synthase